MIGRVTALAALSGLLGTYAFAQDPRVEVSGTAGWTFSDGVNVGAIDDSPIRVDPKDAFSWGPRIGFNLTPNLEMGALFSLQSTDLEASGIINRSIGQTIYNYHGYFAYNFGDPEAKARPYLLGGLGATQYGSLSTATGDIGGETQFSTTWAAGVKLFPGKNVGIRLEARWTPTYIKTDPAGYWCDPYWGCYTVGEAEFSNQYELSGGIILRF